MKQKRNKLAERLVFFTALLGIMFFLLPGSALDVLSSASTNRSVPDAADSPESLETSAIAGYVFHSDYGKTLPFYHVFVEGDHFIGKNTSTNSTGCYSLSIPAGEFTIIVKDKQDLEIFCTLFSIGPNESKRLDLPVDTDRTENSVICGTVRNIENGKTDSFTP